MKRELYKDTNVRSWGMGGRDGWNEWIERDGEQTGFLTFSNTFRFSLPRTIPPLARNKARKAAPRMNNPSTVTY